jgi:hypothetical protein
MNQVYQILMMHIDGRNSKYLKSIILIEKKKIKVQKSKNGQNQRIGNNQLLTPMNY